MAGAQDRVSPGMAQASSVMAERSDPIANYSGAIANHSGAIAKHAEAQEAQEAKEAKKLRSTRSKDPGMDRSHSGGGGQRERRGLTAAVGKGITGWFPAVLRGGAAGAGRQRGPRR